MKAGRFTHIQTLLHSALGEWATGIVARIEHRGDVLFEAAFGSTRNDSMRQPVYVDTRFDLASLTKLFVGAAALQLIAEKKCALDEPLRPWFPEWRESARSGTTMRMLLSHTSGMNSGADYRLLLNENVERFTLTLPLAAAPGERVIYSDLGMIALGVLIERIENRSLNAVLSQRFSRPSLGFRPSSCERPAIPATEEDSWRGRVQGTVHDEKAALLNGVAGHAGLFGTAADVAWLTEQFLGPCAGRHSSLLPASIAVQAVKEAAFDPILRRGWAWALKTNDENSCGPRFTSDSFGHTGFTGTCVWADPKRDLQAVLLTNSVYFGRRDSRPLRAAFYDACIEAIDA